jgi:positive regulator of sigma E activity
MIRLFMYLLGVILIYSLFNKKIMIILVSNLLFLIRFLIFFKYGYNDI